MQIIDLVLGWICLAFERKVYGRMGADWTRGHGNFGVADGALPELAGNAPAGPLKAGCSNSESLAGS